ncbi:hypothetical protein ATCC90586_001374 [Pythium insidiosum]|nr:hypothetical protein ATCC90586_001374 [Pythium insidiosum]
MSGDAAAAGGEKRRKQWRSGGSDQKRHKSGGNGGALTCASTAKGSSGILVTCDRTKERPSVANALNLLNDVADKYFPQEKDQQKDEDGDEEKDSDKADASSVQKMLADEIAALKQDAKQRKTGRFTALDTGVKGVLLIQIQDPNLSAVALVTKILEEVDETKEFPSRFINRLIPLEKIGYSSLEDIKTLAEPLIKDFIAKYQADEATKDTPIEYSVEIKRRNCTGLESREVIDMLASLVGTDHKVNLTTPNVVILVEIFRTTFGMSIVTNFHKYRKFNVRSVIEPPVSTKPKAAEADE